MQSTVLSFLHNDQTSTAGFLKKFEKADATNVAGEKISCPVRPPHTQEHITT